MKQSSIIQLAVFYLILLLSNEGITVATNIRQTVGLRKNIQLSSSLNNMVNMMDSIDVDSFLEVEDMHGMSAEAYGTLEMIEMHKSLKEGFSLSNEKSLFVAPFISIDCNTFLKVLDLVYRLLKLPYHRSSSYPYKLYHRHILFYQDLDI